MAASIWDCRWHRHFIKVKMLLELARGTFSIIKLKKTLLVAAKFQASCLAKVT
jgi:hypothetical protein